MKRGESIISLDAAGQEVPRSFSEPLNSFSGASSVRIIEGGNSRVPEHSHDWPILSLYVMGDCTKLCEDGEQHIDGPSAVLHPAAEWHANRMGRTGLEQIDIQFDPAWLTGVSRRGELSRMYFWKGGEVAAEARRLAGLWSAPSSAERPLEAATSRFLTRAFAAAPVKQPRWLCSLQRRLEPSAPRTVAALARELDLHPSWLGQAYRAYAGESLHHTLQRKRVELATTLLRTTMDDAAEIAAASGFCDQSHMIRCFKSVLGRLPSQVRREASQMQPALAEAVER